MSTFAEVVAELASDDIRLTVEPYLRKLADFQTADQIRDFLVAEGIQAVPGNATKCAIAEYIHQGSGQVVGVTRKSTVVMSDKFARGVGKHTAAMGEFVVRFDNFEYPELVGQERLGRLEKAMQALNKDMKELEEKECLQLLDNVNSWMEA